MSFLKMEVNNGRHTSFWYDSWSRLGCLKTYLRDGGSIDLGIIDNECVFDVLNHHRRRRHRVQSLNEIEDEIEAVRRRLTQDDNIPLWKQS